MCTCRGGGSPFQVTNKYPPRRYLATPINVTTGDSAPQPSMILQEMVGHLALYRLHHPARREVGRGAQQQCAVDRLLVGKNGLRSFEEVAAIGARFTHSALTQRHKASRYSGNPTCLRSAFTRGSPARNANSGLFNVKPIRTGPTPAIRCNCSTVRSLSPNPANTSAY